MPEPGKILGQNHILSYLKNSIKKNAIPHALLFTGIEGLGKGDLAYEMFMVCNCKKYDSSIDEFKSNKFYNNLGACFYCKSCKKSLSKNHPDLIELNPSGLYIRIDQIRELRTILIRDNIEAFYRFVIIYQADKMTIDASNALLKILEEPPEGTIFVLTAIDKSALLNTITSRCQILKFKPVSKNIIFQILIREYNIEPEMAHIMASLSNGSIGRALSMDKPKWRLLRNFTISQLSSLNKNNFGALIAFAEKLSQNNQNINEILNWISTWLRDISIYKYCPEKIINKDFEPYIKKYALKFSQKEIIERIYALEFAIKNINKANQRLTFDNLMLKLAF